MQTTDRPLAIFKASATTALCLSLAACASGWSGGAMKQPEIGVRSKAVLNVDGYRFKDSNGNGTLDAYEDWRRPAEQRADDLVARMSLDDKAGMMLIETLNPDFGGGISATGIRYVQEQRIRRFIFRSVVTANPLFSATPGVSGQQVSPLEAATWTNAVQALVEAQPLGIPALFKSNARNHYERTAYLGINTASGSFTQFPKEPGLAATRDMPLIGRFADVMGEEWAAIGLRGMYGYMADTATEPRWYRVHETFSEDTDLNADIIRTLVTHLQKGPVNPQSPVALTIKHFPGGGPQEMGLDPHYSFGKNQVYPAGRFVDHLKPFKAAIDAGASSIMPYYGVPIDVTYEGVTYKQTGFAFTKQIVTDLLRGKLGFKGYVNSDTNVVTSRVWGMEGFTVPERVAAAINAGNDVLSGFNDKQTITDLVKAGLVPEARVDEAVKRLLREQFQLGLFENPYVDASKASSIIGKAEFRELGLEAQRKSIVLLQNKPLGGAKVLPLPAPTAARPVKLYTLGVNTVVAGSADYGGYAVVSGDYGTPGTPATRPSAAGADYAIIRVEVTNPRSVAATYRSKGDTTGANPALIDPRTGKTWGAQDPCVTHPAQNPACVDDNAAYGFGLVFGGPLPWEVNNLSFTTMAASSSWSISPRLSDIQAVMKEVGAERVILAIYFRNPYVLDEASGLKNTGAILAGFGVSDSALMDVITGKYKPRGKLPFALAGNLEAVIRNDPDAPGYPAADTLFPYGHGLTF